MDRKDLNNTPEGSFKEDLEGIIESQSEILELSEGSTARKMKAAFKNYDDAQLSAAKEYFNAQFKRDGEYYAAKKDEANINLVLEKRAALEKVERMSELQAFAIFNMQARIDELGLLAQLEAGEDYLELLDFKDASEEELLLKRYPRELLDEPYALEIDTPAAAAITKILGSLVDEKVYKHEINYKGHKYVANLKLLADLIHYRQALLSEDRGYTLVDTLVALQLGGINSESYQQLTHWNNKMLYRLGRVKEHCPIAPWIAKELMTEFKNLEDDEETYRGAAAKLLDIVNRETLRVSKAHSKPKHHMDLEVAFETVIVTPKLYCKYLKDQGFFTPMPFALLKPFKY